tara:strand:+ start:1990 stop:2418 length:429 start_codon:yes stop_codon:yes gene_type:complete
MIKNKDFLKIVEKASRWKHNINYKLKPLMYEVTNDLGGMYICEPYKTDLLSAWKFADSKVSKSSALKLKEMFFEYVKQGDFVGADLTKKYLKAGSEKKAIDEKCRFYFNEAYEEIKSFKEYEELKDGFLLKQKTKREKDERR